MWTWLSVCVCVCEAGWVCVCVCYSCVLVGHLLLGGQRSHPQGNLQCADKWLSGWQRLSVRVNTYVLMRSRLASAQSGCSNSPVCLAACVSYVPAARTHSRWSRLLRLFHWNVKFLRVCTPSQKKLSITDTHILTNTQLSSTPICFLVESQVRRLILLLIYVHSTKSWRQQLFSLA